MPSHGCLPRIPRRAAFLPVLVACALSLLGTGCSQDSDPCPENTLVLVVNMPTQVIGDELSIDVLNGQTLVHHGVVKRPKNGTRGRIEVGLGSNYLPNVGHRIYVSPVSDRSVKGRSEAQVVLGPVCTRLEMDITNDPPAPDLSCVGMVVLVTRRTGPLTNNRFQFTDMLNKPIPSATVEACADFDPSCKWPEWRGELVDGVAQLGVDAGFDGFLNVTVSGGDFLPVLVDLPRAVGIMNAHPVIVLLKTATLLDLANAIQADALISERGFITLATFDCRGYRVGGVSLSFKAAPVEGVQPRLYILANNWFPDATLDATDDTGTAFIANLPPGNVRITATYKPTGKVISEFSTRIVAGTISYVAVEPN